MGWLKTAAKYLLLLMLAGLGALVIAVLIAMASLPGFDELKSSPNGQMVRVRAADGSVIVSLGPSYGDWLVGDQIPESMKTAIVAVEDRRFYMHPGIDPVGIARTIWVAKRLHDEGRRLQGASTITQQLARNLFLTNAYSAGRKLREVVLALAMERKFSKAQILELYLNRVYFGGGAYGVDAASRKFFGHPGSKMSMGEAAIVAGLVKAPSNYSPTADRDAAVGRAKVVLEVMQDTGAITASQAEAADPEKVRLAPETDQNAVRYFTDWALAQLDDLVDERTQPIDVWTTIDPAMQVAADKAIRADTPEGAQGALIALDRDGAVRAMVGGRDYVSSIYNRATSAVRQPGSAFKLFVYLTAMEAGMKPDTPVVDEPVTIDGWSPRNSNREYAGPIDIRTAFAFSINTVAAKLGSEVGFSAIADMAHRFGIGTEINTHPSMVLGTSDVRLIDMTRAFAAVARKGVAVTPYGIVKVTTAKGDMLYEHKSDDNRVLVAPWVAAEVTDLLQTAVNTGTARAAQIGRPVAGKTGTTSSNKDGWFLGFSSGITTGVWMGRDDAKPIPGLQGGRAPARAFADFMRVAVAKRPVEQFETQVTLPEWQLEPDEEAYFGEPDEGLAPNPDSVMDQALDAAGVPEDQQDPPSQQAPAPAAPQARQPRTELDGQFLDGVVGRGGERPAQRQGSRPNQ
ncbi:transglycosylase domain-containing protein [Sphingomonas montanisoli]|uniref:PBP1A family penicillin-binding protein n=1 Tax=Sphingomonas montanisoli TaxID=2606412 RepID=A0A5D9C404_9SPHN|nr:PBP1A family penicillin-binding protein [Sphingomonas montanisoli]TZG26409.1 PBP1A family penicillin-binding protein [Sphingomonas montanisoli]